MLNQFNTTSQQRAKKEINAMTLLSLKTPQKVVPALLPTFWFTEKKEAHIEMKENPHSEEGTKCSKLYPA